MKKTQQNPKKINKEKSFDSPKCNMISFGKLNLTFIIEFNPRDLIEMKDGQKIEHSIDDIKSVRDLEFIKDNKELINRIKLKSEDDSIEELIMLNKVSLGNRVIEFFPMQIPKFNNLQFFKSIFEEVTKKYGLVINKTSLDRKQGSTIKINLISGKNFNIFEYEEEEPDKESDMQLQEEHYHSTQTKIVHNKEVDEDEEESEAVKKGLIPKFSRKECILNKLNPSCEKYDLMYLNLCNLEKMEGELNEDDLIELMKFLKEKKKTKIFVNFYKPNKGEVVEPEVNDDYSELENNDNNKEKDQEEEEEKNDEKNSSDENKEKNKKFSNQKHLKQLYDLTDIFFFDEKQALKMFDKHLKSFSKKKTSNNLNKAKLYDYFISSIAGNSNGNQQKIGLFINELEEFIIVICSNKSASKNVLDCKLYPQKTQRNIEVVEDYKKAIQQNKDSYYSIFNALMLGAISSSSKNFDEELNKAFASALTIAKKKLECDKNNIQFNATKLINFNKIKNGNKKNLQNIAQKGREDGFVLDCMNKEKSAIKEYLPLKDKNLKNYYKNENTKNDLVKRGFIDKRGYIFYDKNYKGILGSPPKEKKDKKNLNNIITDLSKNNKIIDNGSGGNIKTKEKIV
jgi:hypothetical protein